MMGWFGTFAAAYEADVEIRRRQEATRIRSPFIPWETVRARLKCSDAVWRRVRKLNPDHRSIKEGMVLRGLNRRVSLARDYAMDIIGPKEFIAKFGRDEYRKIPKLKFIRQGHRKAIPMTYIQDCVPHA